jgi:hypothetical protein
MSDIEAARRGDVAHRDMAVHGGEVLLTGNMGFLALSGENFR